MLSESAKSEILDTLQTAFEGIAGNREYPGLYNTFPPLDPPIPIEN